MEERTMRNQKIAIFMAAALITATVAAADEAYARWTRISAMSCMKTDMLWPNLVGLNNYGQHGANVYCPLRDDSSFPKADINTLNIEGRDNVTNGYLIANVCVAYWYEWAGQCGTSATSGTSYVGHVTLRPSRSVLTDAQEADFAFVQVHIPNGGSNITGIFAAD
jgi:hypothetical protein